LQGAQIGAGGLPPHFNHCFVAPYTIRKLNRSRVSILVTKILTRAVSVIDPVNSPYEVTTA